MSRALRKDMPGLDPRREIAHLAEGGISRIFDREVSPKNLVVEIGIGRGEFLAALAEINPARSFLGVELCFRRVVRMARRLSIAGVENIRLLQARGEEVMPLLPERGVDELWINFPDPWPKRRHHGRRLVQVALISQVVRVLRPGGVIHVATDDVAYANHIHKVLSNEPGLFNRNGGDAWVEAVEGRIPTAYEKMWRALGRTMHFFSYERRLSDAVVLSK